MRHLFDNGDGELVAADTLEDAFAHYGSLGGEPGDKGDWFMVPDTQDVTIRDDNGVPETKRAREWAVPHPSPAFVASSNC
jgi:hypothetical protein